MGTYRLPGFHLQSEPSAGVLAVPRPAEPTGLKHTAPREKFLCIKQEVHTAWDGISDADVAGKFQELVKKHNAKFNPSGVPFKSRRVLEEPEAEEQPEPLRPREGQYPDITALKAGGSGGRA